MNTDELSTPVYVIDEGRIKSNLEILRRLQDNTHCRILLAQKAFSMYRLYPVVAEYLAGASSSGLFEARLAHEEMTGENHVYSPAYKSEEMRELVNICDHITFNSINQLETYRYLWETNGVSVGLRINPEFSTQKEHQIYDPCAPGSRLGIPKTAFPKKLPRGVEGLHFHTLCEQDAEPLVRTFEVVEQNFGEYLHQIKWINLGGGHHITKDGYDLELLQKLLRRIRQTYGLEVYLEPGEAVALDSGYLIASVIDIVHNGTDILILDTSAACHMPDVLEMPYRPPLLNAGDPGTRKYTCRLASRTCLAGDVIGDYSFSTMPKVGDRLVFSDMAIYTMVKNNTFNGMPLPAIVLMREDGSYEMVREFGYEDFKRRLS